MAHARAAAIRLYPIGPQEHEIWSRWAGSVAVPKPNLNGRASWHAALRTLRLGGEGDPARLLSARAEDFPSNLELSEFDILATRRLRVLLRSGVASRLGLVVGPAAT